MENERITRLKEEFINRYGGGEDDLYVYSAPGRINLIGEHIDYAGGYVFPAALTLDNIVIARPRKDRIIEFSATDLEDRVKLSLDNIDEGRDLKWGNYQAGVCDELMKAGYKLTGVTMLFDGIIPFGAGLSSSASIEMATAYTIVDLSYKEFGVDKKIDKIELALIGQKAENNFCGVNSGIMDQFASAMGKKDHAILLDCATLDYDYVPLKMEGYKLVIAKTNKKRGLADSKYNERRREINEGFDILKKQFPNKEHLCQITVKEFEEYKDMIKDDVIRKRVEHCIYENERVKEAKVLLEDNKLKEFGKLLNEAHQSISKLYEATGIELDTMQEEALKIDGVIGARMTGAGFGGCTINIVKEEKIKEFMEIVGKKYEEKINLKPEFFVCEIGDGARRLDK